MQGNMSGLFYLDVYDFTDLRMCATHDEAEGVSGVKLLQEVLEREEGLRRVVAELAELDEEPIVVQLQEVQKQESLSIMVK